MGRKVAGRKADTALERMRSRLHDGPGKLDQSVRRAALAGAPVPDALAKLVDKIRFHAYKVTDGDIQEAVAAGWTESQLFELAVATAVGAGLQRRDVCDRLLAEHPVRTQA